MKHSAPIVPHSGDPIADALLESVSISINDQRKAVALVEVTGEAITRLRRSRNPETSTDLFEVCVELYRVIKENDPNISLVRTLDNPGPSQEVNLSQLLAHTLGVLSTLCSLDWVAKNSRSLSASEKTFFLPYVFGPSIAAHFKDRESDVDLASLTSYRAFCTALESMLPTVVDGNNEARSAFFKTLAVVNAGGAGWTWQNELLCRFNGKLDQFASDFTIHVQNIDDFNDRLLQQAHRLSRSGSGLSELTTVENIYTASVLLDAAPPLSPALRSAVARVGIETVRGLDDNYQNPGVASSHFFLQKMFNSWWNETARRTGQAFFAQCPQDVFQKWVEFSDQLFQNEFRRSTRPHYFLSRLLDHEVEVPTLQKALQQSWSSLQVVELVPLLINKTTGKEADILLTLSNGNMSTLRTLLTYHGTEFDAAQRILSASGEEAITSPRQLTARVRVISETSRTKVAELSTKVVEGMEELKSGVPQAWLRKYITHRQEEFPALATRTAEMFIQKAAPNSFRNFLSALDDKTFYPLWSGLFDRSAFVSPTYPVSFPLYSPTQVLNSIFPGLELTDSVQARMDAIPAALKSVNRGELRGLMLDHLAPLLFPALVEASGGHRKVRKALLEMLRTGVVARYKVREQLSNESWVYKHFGKELERQTKGYLRSADARIAAKSEPATQYFPEAMGICAGFGKTNQLEFMQKQWSYFLITVRGDDDVEKILAGSPVCVDQRKETLLINNVSIDRNFSDKSNHILSIYTQFFDRFSCGLVEPRFLRKPKFFPGGVHVGANLNNIDLSHLPPTTIISPYGGKMRGHADHREGQLELIPPF